MDQIINEIKKFSLDELYELEKHDLQYQALERLFEKNGNKEVFIKLVIANALVSYQLSMSGEKYREKFSEDNCKTNDENFTKNMIEFLKKNNKRLLTARIKRFEKVISFIKVINNEKLENYGKDQNLMLDDLVVSLKQKKDAKTVVFAVKMFVWACKIVNHNINISKNIFIPIDSRLSKISSKKKFWIEVGEKTEYPFFALDTLFYVTLSKNIEEIKNKSLKRKIINFKDFLEKEYIKKD